MKILQVIPFFSPARGGSVLVTYYLSMELAKRGHDIYIVTTDFEFDEEFASNLKPFNVKILQFKCLIKFQLFLYSPGMKKFLNKHIQEFDVIHLHNFRSYQNNVVAAAAIKNRIPYILQAHGSVLRIVEKQRLKLAYDFFWGKKILKKASSFISVSRTELEQYKQVGIELNKINLIPNGLDINSFNDLPEYGSFREKYSLKQDRIILFVGRFHKIKGLDFLIKSFNKLRNEFNDILLVMAGPDDGYKGKLVKLINKLNLKDNVRIFDYIDPKAAYVDADLVVYPSKYEIFGYVPFESILCGTPVIVANKCGCGEILGENDIAVLIENDDIDGLKREMADIIQNPNKAQNMVETGRKYIRENLSWKRICEKFENLYFELIRSNEQNHYNEGKWSYK
ncbi:MAG: glycosyltransferase [Candidatus Hodarchaeota archaeon]